MPLFNKKDKKLTIINEVKIGKEREIQELVENNLEEVFGYKFIANEFAIDNLRIDTLAFDQETNSFVIIEYKRDRSFSVVDQGYAYLSILLNNKADFILEYFEKQNKHISKNDIDWSQSRVLFIANSFTKHQRTAINFKDLPIELWEFELYENSTIHLNQLKASKNAESITVISSGEEVKKVAKEIKTYSVENLFKSDWVDSRDLYEKLSEQILQIDSRIEENFTKSYVGYKVGKTLFVTINPYKSKIELHLCRTEPKDLRDPEDKTVYKKNSLKYFNQHLTAIIIDSEDDIPYSTMLIKQVFDNTFNS